MTWLTAMVHTLKFNTSHIDIDVIHQRTMMESLAYRLNVARSAQNTQLIEKLEHEQQQLAPNASAQAGLRLVEFCLNAMKTGVSQVLWNSSMLRVEEFRCGSDHWWYAVDPTTGEFRYADSEVELHATLEKTDSSR
jgi:hypothetical protein